MSSTPLSTDELATLILGGNTGLFEEVIRRYQGEVMRVAAAMLYDKAAWEDMAQQVFVNVFFALPNFRLGSDMAAWIRAIARNAVREHLRNQARYDHRLRVYREMLATEIANHRQAEASGEWSAEALRSCLPRLPQRQQEALRLRYTDGLTSEQIAQRLGGTAGSIRNLLCEARKALRGMLRSEANR